MRTAMLAAVALLAAACPTRTLALIETDQAKEEVKDVPAELNRNVDILFVVDNSGSMAAEQASVRANFGRFMDVLEAIEGGLPSVHIGVVSSDVGVGHDLAGACNPMGDDGRLRTGKTSCPMVMGRYLSDEEAAGGRQRNYGGSLADAFSCMADLGTAGCGLEQHLEAVRLALDPQANPQNAGFLRPDAYLAVVFLADEDDCSAADRSVFAPGDDVAGALGPVGFRCARWGVTCDGGEIATTPGASYGECTSWDGSPYMRHPRDYVAFLHGLKPDPALVLVAAITGDAEPFFVIEGENGAEVDKSCGKVAGDPNAGAAPGIRFRDFLTGFPGRSTWVSICQDDLSGALEQVAGLIVDRLVPCLTSTVDETDLDAANPGLQIACQVSDVRWPGTDRQVEQVLPRCAMADDANPAAAAAAPCWYVVRDLVQCAAYPTRLALGVKRDVSPPIGTHVIARCVTR